MAQQTAVEWLFSQIPFEWSSSRAAYEALAIAEQMEKKQIEDAYSMGSYDMELSEFRPNQYYNETFGNK
jgi:hypothetical protein